MIIICSVFILLLSIFISVWKLKLGELMEKGGTEMSIYALDQVQDSFSLNHFSTLFTHSE